MDDPKIGNVGALTNGTQGLWIVDTVWHADQWLCLHALENEEKQTQAPFADFWILLDFMP